MKTLLFFKTYAEPLPGYKIILLPPVFTSSILRIFLLPIVILSPFLATPCPLYISSIFSLPVPFFPGLT
jgi:hypothetical protein